MGAEELIVDHFAPCKFNIFKKGQQLVPLEATTYNLPDGVPKGQAVGLYIDTQVDSSGQVRGSTTMHDNRSIFQAFLFVVPTPTCSVPAKL